MNIMSKYYARRTITFLLVAVVVFSAVAAVPLEVSAAVISGKTGIGMAEWALRAYNESWEYVYGGSSAGAVDCSGLIRSYCNGRGGGAKALLDAASVKGNMSSMPRVHGLGLWCEGHAGVYVGKNENGVDMAVDARNSNVDVVYSALDSRSWNPWVKWFKISMVSYPTTGWYTFNGKQYYYHNGEYVIGYFTVDGVTYDFGKSGALKGEVDPSSTTTTTKKTTTTSKKTTTTAKTTTAAAVTTLKRGMTSDAVKQMQTRLIALGYLDSKATGYFGSQTETAVKLFQKTCSLTADGVAGAKTLEKLYSDSAPKYTTTTSKKTTTTAKKTTTTTTTTMTTTTTATTTAATTTTSGEAKTTTAVSATTTAAVQSTTESTTAQEGETSTTPSRENYGYALLNVGSSGNEVMLLQQRLSELGYYDQKISGFYGQFTKDAVRLFQEKSAIEATGIADTDTQVLLYSADALTAQDEAVVYDDAYMTDGGDMYDAAGISEAEIAELIPSDGIGRLSKTASPALFASSFGGSGALQTFGVFSGKNPTVTIFKAGESYTITEETDEQINDCVFF